MWIAHVRRNIRDGSDFFFAKFYAIYKFLNNMVSDRMVVAFHTQIRFQWCEMHLKLVETVS